MDFDEFRTGIDSIMYKTKNLHLALILANNVLSLKDCRGPVLAIWPSLAQWRHTLRHAHFSKSMTSDALWDSTSGRHDAREYYFRYFALEETRVGCQQSRPTQR